MKKLLAILLSALLLCAMIPFATVAAAEGDYYIELVADAEEVNAGDEIVIEVSLYGHESVGIIGAQVELGFDPDVFEIVTYYDEDEEMWMPQIEVGAKFSASSNKYIMFPPIDEETGAMERCLVQYTRGTATASQAVKTNLFYTATLKVKDDAVSGDYTIDVINLKNKDIVMHGNDWGVWTWEPITVTVNGSEPEQPSCEHEYTYECDQICNKCYELTNPNAAHSVKHVEAVAASCYENGNVEYWYCEYCGSAWLDEAQTQVTNLMSVVVPMAHAEATHVEAVAPTCFENGNIEYWVCEACGQAWLDEACTLNTNLLAVVLPMAHGELTHVEAKAPSCYEDGNIEYWTCEACGYAWLDAEGVLSTNLLSVVLPMAHAEATHVAAVAPTCFENGNIEYWYCAECGQAWLDEACTLNTNLLAVVLPMAHGELTHVAAKDATCTANGNIEYWTCEACGYAWLDAEGVLSTNLKAVVLPFTGHAYDDEFDADCNNCGAIRDAACDHTYTYPCDAHCANCGELTNPNAAHSVKHVEAVAASCYENGNVEYWYCEYCGAAWLDEACTQVTNQLSVIVPMAHGEIAHVEAVAPTCYENGNIEYWYCVECGQAWLDADCGLNTNLLAVVLPMAHAEATHVAAVAPSCYENGNIEYWYCAECGQAWLDEACTLNTNLLAVVLPMAHGEAIHVEAKDSTCVELGNIEYWYCADCGQAWLDEACTLNTNLLAVKLPTGDHSYDNEYDADCNVCGAVRDVVAAPGSIGFAGNSISEEKGGLAFLFEIAASDVQIKWWNYYVQGSATVNYAGSDYKLVTMGAVMNNQGVSDLTLDMVDGKYTLNVEAVRLNDLTEDALYFAVRAVNLPLNHINTTIYARPYMVLEKDGAQIVIYGDVQGASYNEIAAQG